jgi:hypothetical protein
VDDHFCYASLDQPTSLAPIPQAAHNLAGFTHLLRAVEPAVAREVLTRRLRAVAGVALQCNRAVWGPLTARGPPDLFAAMSHLDKALVAQVEHLAATGALGLRVPVSMVLARLVVVLQKASLRPADLLKEGGGACLRAILDGIREAGPGDMVSQAVRLLLQVIFMAPAL